MGYRANVTAVLTQEVFSTYIKQNLDKMGNSEIIEFNDGSIAMKWKNVKWDSTEASVVFQELQDELACLTEPTKGFKLYITGEDNETETYSNVAGDIVFADVKFETLLPNIPEVGEYGYRTTIPNNVREDIEREVRTINPDYRVRAIIRHPEKEDSNLYKVVAENVKKHTYSYWESYYAARKSLNHGHYNISLSEAMQMLWK